jgi:hypothetical protein
MYSIDLYNASILLVCMYVSSYSSNGSMRFVRILLYSPITRSYFPRCRPSSIHAVVSIRDRMVCMYWITALDYSTAGSFLRTRLGKKKRGRSIVSNRSIYIYIYIYILCLEASDVSVLRERIVESYMDCCHDVDTTMPAKRTYIYIYGTRRTTTCFTFDTSNMSRDFWPSVQVESFPE